MISLYVAGPFSAGDVILNIRRAIDCAETLYQRGFAPFVPHLYATWHGVHEHTYGEWMELDDHFLRLCDAVYRMPGESGGADIEVDRARTYGIPVFTDYEELEAWAETKGAR